VDTGCPADVHHRESGDQPHTEREDAERQRTVATAKEHHDRSCRGERQRPEVRALNNEMPGSAEHERQLIRVRQ